MMMTSSSSAIIDSNQGIFCRQGARLGSGDELQIGPTGPVCSVPDERKLVYKVTDSYVLPDTALYDVSAYIIAKCRPVSAARLQLLTYYAYVWTLVWDDKELFKCDILAGINGPLIKPLYDLYKGGAEITKSILGFAGNLSEENRASIDAVLSAYSRYKTSQLIQIAIKEPPWQQARGGSQELYYRPIIRKDLIFEYYSSLVSDTDGEEEKETSTTKSLA